LVLRWPAEHRKGAQLSIDGRSQNLEQAASGENPDELRFPLEPGLHKLWISKPGHESFGETVSIIEGKDVVLTPLMREMASISPGPITNPPKPPEKTSPPNEPTKSGDTPPATGKKMDKPPDDSRTSNDEESRRLAELAAKEKQYSEAVREADELVNRWDFRGAVEALMKVSFSAPDLQARLAEYRRRVELLAAMKNRFIDTIKSAAPRLTSKDLMLRGVASGEITGADEHGLTVVYPGGTKKLVTWQELNPRCVQQLLQRVADRGKLEDWLVVDAILGVLCHDPAWAEKSLEKLRELGISTDDLVAQLAERTFAQVKAMLARKEFDKAEDALKKLEEKFASTPWLRARRAEVDEAKDAIRRERAEAVEARAEKLYAEAAELFRRGEFFELRPLVERFRNEFASSRLWADTQRKPTLRELEHVVANLGRFFQVRRDGKGTHQSVGAAVADAPPYSLIEIQDDGPYFEAVRVPENKIGLTIRGGKKNWPVISSGGPLGDYDDLFVSRAAETVLQRLVLLHHEGYGHALQVADRARLRQVVVASNRWPGVYAGERFQAEHCFFGPVGYIRFDGGAIQQCFLRTGSVESGYRARGKVSNVVVLASARSPTSETDFRGKLDVEFATCLCSIKLASGANVTLRDSIMPHLIAIEEGNTVDYCLVGHTAGTVTLGKHCLTATPQFVNINELDFRLGRTSPGRGKASDSGDIGARPTPEMMEVLRKALELRAQKLLRF
jgi:tetratricopeptide (TPR) repeat protein